MASLRDHIYKFGANYTIWSVGQGQMSMYQMDFEFNQSIIKFSFIYIASSDNRKKYDFEAEFNFVLLWMTISDHFSFIVIQVI